MKHIEIQKIIQLVTEKKFETTCAAFDVADHIFKIEVPRSLRGRKLAVQSMSLLADGHIKYDYVQPATLKSNKEEINTEEEDNQELSDETINEVQDSTSKEEEEEEEKEAESIKTS